MLNPVFTCTICRVVHRAHTSACLAHMHAAMASGTPEAAKEFLTIALALLLALQRYLQTTKKNPHLQQGPIPSAVPHPIRTVKEVRN